MQPDQLPTTPGQETSQDSGAVRSKTAFLNKISKWHLLIIGVGVIVAGIIGAYALSNNPAPTNNSQNIGSVSTNKAPNSSTQSTNANTWKGTVNPASIPLGDGNVSTTPEVGYVDSCTTTFRGGGARHSGSWLDTSTNTWNSVSKLAVEGSVSWPSATYSNVVSGSNRVITTNDLPQNYTTGIFPISSSDPAYQYDTNPNHIAAQNINYSLPIDPVAANSPGCLGLGPIGVMTDGVLLYDALDAAGRDAGAHEVQDSCSGHPDGSDRYHYHSVSVCMLSKATSASTLVGYALDGYGIYVERDSKGNLPTNADLDACHGRTSQVMWNGKLTNIYHYDATLEYPYTIGCYHGTPISMAR